MNRSNIVRLVEWPQIGKELEAHGWESTHIAEALNLDPTTVRKWFLRDAEPLFSSGFRLIRLHAIVTGKKRNMDSNLSLMRGLRVSSADAGRLSS